MKVGMEQKSHAEIMPPRVEEGYFFAPLELEMVRSRLQVIGYMKIEFPSPYVQTIYFAESSGRTPQGGYIRLRRYSSKTDPTIQILDSDYYLEGKLSGGPKERIILPTDASLEILLNISSRGVIREMLPNTYSLIREMGQLYPVVATEWLREHYVLDQSNRATIDTELMYFGFLPGQFVGQSIGEVEEHKIEFKSLNGENPSAEVMGLNLIPIPRKWHERTIRSMYGDWLAGLNKQYE